MKAKIFMLLSAVVLILGLATPSSSFAAQKETQKEKVPFLNSLITEEVMTTDIPSTDFEGKTEKTYSNGVKVVTTVEDTSPISTKADSFCGTSGKAVRATFYYGGTTVLTLKTNIIYEKCRDNKVKYKSTDYFTAAVTDGSSDYGSKTYKAQKGSRNVFTWTGEVNKVSSKVYKGDVIWRIQIDGYGVQDSTVIG
ncbi:hypothetical protein ACQCU3_03515 [Bacillus altitudinis]|uniref:hypothetical protein n=1 Tax=Bacillus TaxID=1386 RepID=UPI00064CC71A|nr:hypothetical protein [Bacillus altitudinis]KLV19204.1 hypothetical protein ABW03_14650 [Bacillus altitudinis]TYS30572.1 hypothetical protein FZC69_01545 [Bacillus altitudinis]